MDWIGQLGWRGQAPPAGTQPVWAHLHVSHVEVYCRYANLKEKVPCFYVVEKWRDLQCFSRGLGWRQSAWDTSQHQLLQTFIHCPPPQCKANRKTTSTDMVILSVLTDRRENFILQAKHLKTETAGNTWSKVDLEHVIPSEDSEIHNPTCTNLPKSA